MPALCAQSPLTVAHLAGHSRILGWNVYTVTAAVSGLALGVHLALRGPDIWASVTFMAAVLLTDLGFTFVERRRRKTEAISPEPPVVRTPRLIELELAEAHLAGLRVAYKAGRTSGHPEDTLWDIEDAEKWVARLRSGTD